MYDCKSKVNKKGRRQKIGRHTWKFDMTVCPGLQEHNAPDYYDFAACNHAILNFLICTWRQVHCERRAVQRSVKTDVRTPKTNDKMMGSNNVHWQMTSQAPIAKIFKDGEGWRILGEHGTETMGHEDCWQRAWGDEGLAYHRSDTGICAPRHVVGMWNPECLWGSTIYIHGSWLMIPFLEVDP